MSFIDDVINASGLKCEDILGDPKQIQITQYLTKEHYDYFDDLLNNRKKIIVHGDYDGDGLCGSSIIYSYLKKCGFEVCVKIPKRHEGYGINPNFPDDAKKSFDPALVITVDCGISNKQEIDRAKELGIDFIVTDHHELPDQIPEAKYIFHPFLMPENQETKYLSGTGMAYWLAWQLNFHYKIDFDFESWSSVAAMGLISDYVPLLGTTREIVKVGLKVVKENPPIGLQSFIDANQIKQEYLDEEALAFNVIPLFNAAGRMSDPLIAFSVLTTEDYFAGARTSVKLNDLNVKRKELTQQYIDDAIYRLNEVEEDKMSFIISNDWQHGIVGITSAKLVEMYDLPSFVVCKEGAIYKGSVRSPEWFDCMEALNHAKEFTVRYGGHKHAAGFTLRPDQLIRFKFALIENAQKQFMNERKPQNVLEWKQEYFDLDLVEEIKKLQPFGEGFKKPLFLIKNQPLTYMRTSMDGKHLFCKINKIAATMWNGANLGLTKKTEYDIVFKLGLDSFNSETQYVKALITQIKESEQQNG